MSPSVRRGVSSWRSLLLLVVVVAACSKAEQPDKGVKLTGAGATFPEPLYQTWTLKYAVEAGATISYRAAGSSAGVEAITLDGVNFGASDSPMTDDELGQAGDVLHVPLTVGAVTVVYHAAGAPAELAFTPEILAGIYLGTITRWDDREIAAVNQDADLPDLAIVPIHRSDGSGTTRVFSEMLARQVPAWKEKVGAKRKLDWPAGKGAAGTKGVSVAVLATKGAIGYLALNHARADRHAIARVQNDRGRFVAPSLDSLTAATAAAGTSAPDDLRIPIVDGATEGAYPMATFSYALVRREQPDEVKGAALARFLSWAIHDGQNHAPRLHYGTLPPEVVSRAEGQLASLTHGGEPLVW